MSSIARSVLVITATWLAFGGQAHAQPVAIPIRNDLWNNPACHEMARPRYAGSDASPMLDFNIHILEDFRAGRRPAALEQVDQAYDYAVSHCFVDYFGEADAAFDKGHYREAFDLYENDIFDPAGHWSRIGPPYIDTGAAQPLRDGLDAAKLGAYGHAAAYLRKSIALAPDFEEAHFFLGEVLYIGGRARDARIEWLAALNSYGIVSMNKDERGPDPPWVSALRMFEIHKYDADRD